MFYISILAKSKKISDNTFLEAKENNTNIINLQKKSKNSKKYDSFIITEYNGIEPYDRPHEIRTTSFNFNYKDDLMNSIKNSMIYLPPIILPQTPTISKYYNFFSSCLEGAILLPAFISKCLYQGTGIDVAEEYFELLLSIYDEVREQFYPSKSILSSLTNKFVILFKLCFYKFKLAWLDLDYLDINDFNFYLPNLIDLPPYTKQPISPLKWEK